MKLMKKYVGLLLGFLFVFCGICFSLLNLETKSAYAQENGDALQDESFNDDDVSTRGIYTSLSLSINGGDSKIWVTVKNDITIFPATVLVIVELYSSDTYYESHTDMQLVSRNSTQDLDMGQTITVEAPTGGVEKYWQGRMRYKVDNGAWKTGTTGTMRYSADGTFLDIV